MNKKYLTRHQQHLKSLQIHIRKKFDHFFQYKKHYESITGTEDIIEIIT